MHNHPSFHSSFYTISELGLNIKYHEHTFAQRKKGARNCDCLIPYYSDKNHFTGNKHTSELRPVKCGSVVTQSKMADVTFVSMEHRSKNGGSNFP